MTRRWTPAVDVRHRRTVDVNAIPQRSQATRYLAVKRAPVPLGDFFHEVRPAPDEAGREPRTPQSFSDRRVSTGVRETAPRLRAGRELISDVAVDDDIMLDYRESDTPAPKLRDDVVVVGTSIQWADVLGIGSMFGERVRRLGLDVSERADDFQCGT